VHVEWPLPCFVKEFILFCLKKQYICRAITRSIISQEHTSRIYRPVIWYSVRINRHRGDQTSVQKRNLTRRETFIPTLFSNRDHSFLRTHSLTSEHILHIVFRLDNSLNEARNQANYFRIPVGLLCAISQPDMNVHQQQLADSLAPEWFCQCQLMT